MNKTIIALCLFLVFTSIQATFTPEWVSCDSVTPYRTWESLNVTLDAPPVAGKNSTFTLCGKSLAFEFWTKSLTVTSGTVLDLTFPEPGFDIWYGDSRCFDVNFEIPQGFKDLELQFLLNGAAFDGAGCANVTLHLDNQHKFLRHSF